jgi:hypothetical protein
MMAQRGHRDGLFANLMPERGREASARFGFPSHLIEKIGVPGVTRTPDPQFRKLLLYPAELRGHKDFSPWGHS